MGHSFLSVVPWVVVIPWLIANVFPYVAALLTKAPSWVTAAVNTVLSIVTNVLTQFVHQGGDFTNFPWVQVTVNCFITFAVARLHYVSFLKATRHEAALHSLGNKGPVVPVNAVA